MVVGIMGPRMALDLLEALNGIPNATTADQRAAAKIGLEHDIWTDSLRRRIRDAMPGPGK